MAIQMVKTFVKPNGDMKVKARWFNIVNPDNIYFIDNENILITKDQRKNWKLYEGGLK